MFTENHQIIGRLPITTVWTTNFDSLLERAFERAGRKVDVKCRDQDVTLPRRRRDVVLYKMHGDIARPDELIICKNGVVSEELFARLNDDAASN